MVPVGTKISPKTPQNDRKWHENGTQEHLTQTGSCAAHAQGTLHYSQGTQRSSGNARADTEQIYLMLPKNNISELRPDTLGLNSFCVSGTLTSTFTICSVLNTVKSGDYEFNIDLEDVYFHIPIHSDNQNTSALSTRTRCYQFRVLPFSLNTDSQVFTHLWHTVAGHFHRPEISVLLYLNDWLVHHPDHQVLLCN